MDTAPGGLATGALAQPRDLAGISFWYETCCTNAAMDTAVFLALAGAFGGAGFEHPGLVAVTASAWAVALLSRGWTRWRVATVILAAAIVCVQTGRARAAMRAYEVRQAEITRAFHGPVRCWGSGEVRGSPVESSGEPSFVARVTTTCDAAEGGPARYDGPVALHGPAGVLARGDRVELVVQVAPRERFSNTDGTDGWGREARRDVPVSGAVLSARIVARAAGPRAFIDRARAFTRSRIHATFPAATDPLARALVLGESDLPAADDLAFRESGLSHLLAVSGMHLVIVVATFVRLVGAVLARLPTVAGGTVHPGRWAAGAGAVFALAYADYAGGSGSALRAGWMMAIGLGAIALGRRASPERALAASMAAMSIADPLVAYDVSFVLSVLATGGLMHLARPIGAALERVPRVPVVVRESLAQTVAATIPCAPVLSTIAPSLSVGGVFANVIAVPIGEALALPVCMVHALLSPLPLLERGAAVLASGALLGVREIARVTASFGFLKVEVPPVTPAQACVLACMVALLSTRLSRRAVVAGSGAIVVALELAARRAGAPTGALRVTFLDVGQGDSALVDLPSGEAMLIDGGGLVGSPLDPGERAVAPVLRARRRSELAVVVLSHPHPDHFIGFGRGLARLRWRAAWDSGQGEREGTSGEYAGWLARTRRGGGSVLRPPALCGRHAIGGAEIEVLAPCPALADDTGANDNSIVIRIRYGRRAILFLGDAERAEEGRLLVGGADLAADVVKIGHHGSRTSTTPGLVDAVRPIHAVISTGVRNRFGHPHAATLATLGARGIRVWRTDREGAVVVDTDGEGLAISSVIGAR